MLQIAKDAKRASTELRASNAQTRNKALSSIAEILLQNSSQIIAANEKDLEAGRAAKLSEAMLDRLTLNQNRITAMAQAVNDIVKQEEVLGQIVEERTRPNGLKVQKELIPLGVVCMIFESRPNVVVDAAALALKSGNAIVLKGGKEAQHSNKILTDIIQDALAKSGLNKACVQQIDSRDAVSEVLKLKDYIDVVIPRGGEKLINYVYDNATMPVIAHFQGLCHIYVHEDADLTKALPIILNAKVQRPGVCNAMECLILHKNLPSDFKQKVFASLQEKGVELRVDKNLLGFGENLKTATEEDYATEWLDLILSVKEVSSVAEAISHIQKFGSHHTESILAKDPQVIAQFKQSIDCSCLVVNTSTRFNDGGELGLGAELGISTSKFHAYGPMGTKELTTARFLVTGTGQVRN